MSIIKLSVPVADSNMSVIHQVFLVVFVHLVAVLIATLTAQVHHSEAINEKEHLIKCIILPKFSPNMLHFLRH